jgi:hypothetical protein
MFVLVLDSFSLKSASQTCITTCLTSTRYSTKGTTLTTTTITTALVLKKLYGFICFACKDNSLPLVPLTFLALGSKRDTAALSKQTLTTPGDYGGHVAKFLLIKYLTAIWVPLKLTGSSSLFCWLEDKKFNIAVQGLYGCTSVVVAS